MQHDHGIILYHAPMAVCAAKVRMTLAEKALAWKSVVIDLAAGEQFSPAYRLIHPGAVVPALVHDGRIIRDSTVINEYLDEVFEDPPLRPCRLQDRSAMRLWTKQEDDIQAAINTLVTVLVLRPMQRTGNNAAAPRDPDRRERWDSLMTLGLESPHVDRGLRRLARWLDELDRRLQENEWLAGDTFSLADIGHAPYLHALASLQLSEFWRNRFAAVERWRRNIGVRASFISGVTDFVSPRAAAAWERAGLQHRSDLETRFQISADINLGDTT